MKNLDFDWQINEFILSKLKKQLEMEVKKMAIKKVTPGREQTTPRPNHRLTYERIWRNISARVATVKCLWFSLKL